MNNQSLASLFLLIILSCNKKSENTNSEKFIGEKESFEILTEKISNRNLPKEIDLEGKLKEITKLKDLSGEHLIILTETGEITGRRNRFQNFCI